MNNAWIVVPAAGVGERMGGSTPKQYLSLGDASVLQQTLQQLLKVPDVQGIVVVLSADDTLWSGLEAAKDPRVYTVIGGSTRAESVMAGLQFVLDNSSRETWVLVHDAARALIQLSDIQRLTDAVYNSGAVGGILGMPVQDTLKRADEYYCIEDTVDRQALWQAQTPQLFPVGSLHDAMTNALSDSKVVVTDEASAMELAGQNPLLVEALQPNFKITRPVDLRIANALLNDEVLTA